MSMVHEPETDKPVTQSPATHKPVTHKHGAVVTLPSDTQILVTREFDAPARLVYRAWTTPELIKRWWAGDNGEVVSIEVDLRVGGMWRYVMTARGFEVAFHGTFREIVPNERLVDTTVYEAIPDASAQTTVTFTETDGRTTLAILTDHSNRENRDGHVNSGMESGLQSSLDLLEETVLELR
jgi:uncharacterized protein YndB with AHSA1/START domain